MISSYPPLDLVLLQETVAKWTAHNFPDAKRWEPLIGMGEELGEVNHAFLKVHQQIRGYTEQQALEEMADGIGDIFIYACHFCSLNGINLNDAVCLALQTVLKRDWKADATSAKPLSEIQ